jgi:hypothetical protein
MNQAQVMATLGETAHQVTEVGFGAADFSATPCDDCDPHDS